MVGRHIKWVVIAAWVLAALVALPFQSKLQALASDESDAFQTRDAESARVDEIIDTRFTGGNETTAVILYARDEPLTPPDLERIASDASAICNPLQIRDIIRVITPTQLACGELPPLSPPPSSPIKATSEDQTTQLVTAWTKDDATETVVKDVAAMRAITPDGQDGLDAYVTGEAGFAADQAAALEGIDETLLAVTLALVIVLLGVIYRSPIVALVPVFVVGIAYLVAAALVYAGAKAGLYQATGQATAILIVLMFGAGTDYCLLLLARYREELGNPRPDGHSPQTDGARNRLRRRDRGRGDARAGDRRLQRDALDGPGAGDRDGRHRARRGHVAARRRSPPSGPPRRRASRPTLWPRIGKLVKERPAALTVAVLAVLVAGALGNLKDSGTLDFSEQFRTAPNPSKASSACSRSSRPAKRARSTCSSARPPSPRRCPA